MATYPQRVRDNILPLSVGATLPEAFEEWSFTERTVDHEEPVANCELCNQEELRYHFEIKNALTHRCLWVGSQCILKFNLSVFERGQRLSPAEAKKKLDRLTKQMQLDSCVNALQRLVASEESPILANALAYFRTNKNLSPKYGFVVLWKLRQHRIEHHPSFFNINLKRDKYKADLRQMELSRVHVLWPALTTSQRNMALRFGHTAPP